MYGSEEFKSLIEPFLSDELSFVGLKNLEVQKKMQNDSDMKKAMTTGTNRDIAKYA